MMFATVPTSEAGGGILVHSITVGKKRLRKGRALSQADIDALQAAGIDQVTIAKLDKDELGEDESAGRIADSLLAGTSDIDCSAPFTGRANLYAEIPGLVQIDAERVMEINRVDPAITLATLPNLARVSRRSMIATVKIIPYGVHSRYVAAAAAIGPGTIRLRPVVHRTAGLVLTRVTGQPQRLMEKGRAAIESRLSALGIRLSETWVVDHDPIEVGVALQNCEGNILLILTGSATSDQRDVGPDGLKRAGGELHRFGMPVDPGNLLFYGDLGSRPVIGLPGCARSPALNGADWVLERLACGLKLSDSDFAAMGTGGLLKEIPVRPQPRAAAKSVTMRPVVEAVILQTDGSGKLERAVAATGRSKVDKVHAIAPASEIQPTDSEGKISRGEEESRQDSVFPERIRAGMASLTDKADAVLLIRSECLVEPVQINRLIAAFSPADGREICELRVAGKQKCLAILLGKRFFESLAGLTSQAELDNLRREAKDFLVEFEI